MQLATDKPKRSLISLTPLIDVVFILLIFFMLASSFLEWQFVELSVGEAEPLQVQDESYSLIKVKAGERYELNGQLVTLENLITDVRERMRLNSNHAVIIQPEGDLPLQALVTVFDQLKPFVGENLSLAKDEKSP